MALFLCPDTEENYSPGTNAPPLHPNCRSTISGSLKGPGGIKTGTRIAKAGNGKTYHVPADMRYEYWKTVFVEKKNTFTQWQMETNRIPPTDKFIQSIAISAGMKYTLGKKGEERFYADDGQPIYPMNDGAVGNIDVVTIPAGAELLSRYGYSGGQYLSPEKTTFEERALPRGTNLDNYHVYKVLRDIKLVEKGIIAAWFGQKGGGVQYKLHNRIRDLHQALNLI